MEKRMIAKIAVSAAVFSIDRPYDYIVPDALAEKAVPGARVTVPFGKGNRRSEGMILSVTRETEFDKLKCVESVIDSEPVLDGEQLKLALWMRDRFFCTVYEAVKTMLPIGMWSDGKGSKRVGDKVIETANLLIDGEEAMELADQKKLSAPAQSSILRLMAQIGSAPVKDICIHTGASRQSVKALEKRGVIGTEFREVYRRPMIFFKDEDLTVTLNREQKAAFDGLNILLESGKPEAALLYGVTGSGKTLVYIRLIQETLDRGRNAIILVPEIGLTPQLLSTFSGFFGDSIAVLHSSLTMGERYDEWKRIRSGEVRVVVGTRSAVFAPLNDIGLIIIDEEQEHTYKSENSPRYNARDVAKYRCVRHNALLLLGSATPAVESMYAARQGKYKLFEIHERYNKQRLPEVIIVDMRREIMEDNGSSVSAPLRAELMKNIDRGEQSILFINRRGASAVTMCGECGHTFTCKNCSVSMTYHSVNNRLICHYCGHSVPLPKSCPECGGRIKFIGAGTQRVEEELHSLFPGAEVLRMDTDTVSAKSGHEKILGRFAAKKIPILVGTQMVTKGLNFDNVTLAGVISADQMMYINDFRAYERMFSVMTQVIGRSGRGDKTGRAVIQTYTPDNEVIRLAAEQDYMSFYTRELEMRRLQGTPPFSDIFEVTVLGPEEDAVIGGCRGIKSSLMGYLGGTEGLSILGPAPAGIAKVNNKYRYRIMIRCRNTKQIRETIAHVVREFSKDRSNRGLSAFADYDPLN
ncbi:MAG: primosomal protein N' [Oscillospiraceae bacterium]|nr:primosomal protein N' [Oscillospiraceae bacterium]